MSDQEDMSPYPVFKQDSEDRPFDFDNCSRRESLKIDTQSTHGNLESQNEAKRASFKR